MEDALTRAAARLETWCRDAALPFWAGVQESSGAWPECLHLDGTPDRPRIRRHRVQARQVFSYALATKLGWFDGREVVRSGVDFMWRAGRQGGGPGPETGLLHRLNADGTPADTRRDLYDHAFYLLALGWAEATIGGQGGRLRDLTAFLDSLVHPAGGYREGVPATLPRRQNPHMHLFETCLSLHGLGVEGDWLRRAKDLHALFESHFFDPSRRIIREHFSESWQWDGGNAEPGHAVEWVWLLREYEVATGTDTRPRRDALYGSALLSGAVWLLDGTTPEGDSVRETSRLWVQTELVKAHVAQARSGVPGARGMAAAAVDGLLADWLHPDGTWTDQRGACGQRISDTVPTSTLYHILLMASEVAELARERPAAL